MTPSNYRAGGAQTDIHFAVGERSLGSILVAQSDRGICAILLGDDPDSLARDLQDQFPKANLIGGDAGFERLVAKVVGFVEAAARGLDRKLHGRCKAHRLSEFSTRGRPGLRRQRAGSGNPLPSRGTQRWRIVGLSLGRRAQTRASRKGGARMIRIEGIGELQRRVKPAVKRVDAFDWQGIGRDLDQQGNAMMEQLLSPEECRGIAGLYPNDDIFRSRVVMGRHGFGRGEYKYFSYPLPDLLSELRTAVYKHLVPVANRWNDAMGIDARYPEQHADFVECCHNAGQVRPTPLLLQYGVDDYNCLHQDLYGEHVFPLQLAILLSDPGADFTGGEFIMTEQRPRMQSRPMVVPLRQGDGVIFAVHNRPVQGTRGTYRVNLRHGVSRVLSGRRHTVGIIFHDAI